MRLARNLDAHGVDRGAGREEQRPEVGTAEGKIGGDFRGPDDAEARATLLAAADQGIDHFDTAASYQLGENEKFVGAVLAPLRQRLFIATKCGLSRSPEGGAMVDNRPDTIRADCGYREAA